MAYDDSGGSTAARLWWMLTVLGQPAAVLDGGLAAWTGPLATGPSTPVAVDCPPRSWPDAAVVGLPEVEAIVAGCSVTLLIDARAEVRYRGGGPAIDPRPGHIPGAVSAEFAGNLGADGRFLPPVALADRYRSICAAGADVAVSCGSGITACHDALAMVVAGLPFPRLYVGSYSQWSADPARPVATDG